jgi:hypothetical protein
MQYKQRMNRKSLSLEQNGDASVSKSVEFHSIVFRVRIDEDLLQRTDSIVSLSFLLYVIKCEVR